MKIGFFIPEFPGQTHSFFWREMQAIQTLFGHETSIVSTRKPPQPVAHEWVAQAHAEYLFPVPVAGLLRAGLHLLRHLPRLLRDRDTRALLGNLRLWAMLLMAARLSLHARRAEIDHLHVHSCANAALIAAFCNRLCGLPYSLVLHGPVEDYGPHQPYKWRRAAFVFVITEVLRAEMAERLPEAADKMHIVPMGVDTDRFAPAAAAPAPPPFRWFSCARLNRIKGFETLIAAFEQVTRSHPELPWQLFIAGEDEQGGSGYRKTLEALIDTGGLQDRVTLLGAVTQQEVLRNLQVSHGFVLASHHEPLGVAYMEAMACALPTIGTDAGGVRELITDGQDGLLVPPQDAEALAAALVRIMTAPEEAATLAAAGRDRIIADFGAARSARVLGACLSG